METTDLNHTAEDQVACEVTVTSTAAEENSAADYSVLSKEELIAQLRSIVEGDDIANIRDEVEAIKSAFYKQRKNEVDAMRRAYAEGGGNPEEFVADKDDAEQTLKDLINAYRGKRDDEAKELETIQNRNYQIKLEIIEKLKELINSEESIGETFTTFRNLQNQWKEVGNVPKANVNDLWETYHHYTERFYEYVKINNELRDIDLKKNYETKAILSEKAEALIDETNIIVAFRELQSLHDQWREVGPVMQNEKDAIWNRFKVASTIINKRHQDHFEKIRDEQVENLNKKSDLCIRVEGIVAAEYAKHADWEKATADVIELQREWKGIGFAPKKDNNAIYERFRAACNLFFDHKQAYYTKQKESVGNTVGAKVELCEKAEALQENTDWANTTNELIRLQGEWKKLGFSSRKEGEALWKRFRAACDKFFEARTQHQASVDVEYVENLRQKEAIIEELKSFSTDMDADDALNALKEIQKRWSGIGFTPIKDKNRVNSEYREIINKLFAAYKIKNSENQLDRYRDRVSKFRDGAKGAASQERDKLSVKLKRIEADITVWENNIGFFANSKGAEELIRDVEHKIAKAKEDAKQIIEKLRILND